MDSYLVCGTKFSFLYEYFLSCRFLSGKICPGWAESRFTVVGMENNTVINKQHYKNKLFHVLTDVTPLLPALLPRCVGLRLPLYVYHPNQQGLALLQRKESAWF